MSILNKYAPNNTDDLVIVDEATRQRIEDYAEGYRTGHVLLHGPKGTGKSSVARVIAETLCGVTNGAFTATYEGATFGSADFDRILNDWSWQQINGAAVGVAVINEIDLLSPALREKLKAFMDDNAQIGQIIATTNNDHVLTPAHLDRFDVIELPPISPEAFEARISEMLANEGVTGCDDVVREMLATTNGSWREALAVAEDIVITSKRRAFK